MTNQNKGRNLKNIQKTLSTLRFWMKKLGYKLVYGIAEFSYLPVGTSERINISHLHHCSCKIRTKSWTALAILGHNTVRRSSIKKHLIWLKKAFSLNEILEIIVIKRIGCHQIQGCKIVITIPIINRTPTPPSASKASIDVSSIVVYSIAECHTSCLPYCMRTCIQGTY